MGLRGSRPKRTCPRARRARELNPSLMLHAARGEPLGNAEIAAVLGITEQGVNLTLNKALRKLRELPPDELDALFRAWFEG